MYKNYELIEHTADIGIRVKGDDLQALFKNAALAMFEIMAERKSETRDKRQETREIIVRQKADNLEGLFINWLNELLSLSATKELIFNIFKIDKLDENNLKAIARGSDIENFKVKTEIKAATYHELKLEKTKSSWQAQIIFDV